VRHLYPASIRKHLERNGVFLVDSQPSRSRRPISRRPAANENIDKQLARDAKKAESEGNFSPTNIKEGRERVFREINLRRGQPEFRAKLLEAYRRRCAITGCDCPDALEAAHILPYRGKETNHIQNGILLRSDIHTLFDLGKIGINPVTHQVIVSNSLSRTVYEKIRGKKLRLPAQSGNKPSAEVLRKHMEQSTWTVARPASL
jgi:putative restriction endonuclease